MSAWFDTYGFSEVHLDLLVGAYPQDDRDVQRLKRAGVERVLNLVEDSEYGSGRRAQVEAAYDALDITEARLPLVDFGSLPQPWLEQAVSQLVTWRRGGDRVYVHCRAGWQRSASVAAGAIAILDSTDVLHGLAQVQTHRATADPLPHQREDLAAWWADRTTPPPPLILRPLAAPQRRLA